MSTTVTDVIWQPTKEYLDSRVMDFCRQEGLKDWQELVKKSTEDTEWFWSSALKYMGVQWQKPYDKLLDQSGGFEWAKWFCGGKLNVAYNCLDWHLQTGRKAGVRESVGKDHPAIIWEAEDGSRSKMTYGELNDMSGRVAATLKSLGVKPGDAVGIYMPMVPEVVAVLFGCLKYGAVAVPVFSGYGAQALIARLIDSQASVLFTSNFGMRKGKAVHIKADADAAAKEVPGLKHIVVLKHGEGEIEWQQGRDLWFHDVVLNQVPLETNVELDAEHPSMYLYTSGTTGKPKGCVHTHGGALAQISKELGFAYDVRPEDVFFWVSDIGWMMGPWEMIGVTFWGGTVVIFEGAPMNPPDILWQIVARNKVTTLGISPTAIRSLRTFGDQWVDNHDLSTLRLLGSTGEPWDEDSYMWFFDKIGKRRCPIINISGGTEIVGCLLMPLPVMPLKPCTLGTSGLAMDIDVFDEQGNSIRNAIGHLVCKKPAPSMTKGFLRDPNRYLETYFSKFPGVWYHGDWAKIDDDGAVFLFGRSDDTIKVAGKRVGPGEVESALIEHKDVAEAAVIGVPHEIKGEALAAFVVLMPNCEMTDALRNDLRRMCGERLGPTLRPDTIHSVKALPKTRSGKIVRGAIKRKYLNEPLGDASSVENPEALDYIGACATSNLYNIFRRGLCEIGDCDEEFDLGSLYFVCILRTECAGANLAAIGGAHAVADMAGVVPDARPATGPEETKTTGKDELVAGKPYVYVGRVSKPTITVYSPKEKNTGAAVVVFPGGGYQILAMDLEGTEVCDWLTSKGITAVLLKYRVPGVDQYPKSGAYPKSKMALDDAQRAVGLVRFHAAEWHIDPKKIGVLGFAGGHLSAAMSTHFAQRIYKPVDAADKESCRPDFAVVIYPGHLSIAAHTDELRDAHKTYGLNPAVPVTKQTPPTFLLQAENDQVDSVEDSLVYYEALKNAGVPVEMHLYAQGGHAFGMRRTKFAITAWPQLVETWLASIGMIPTE